MAGLNHKQFRGVNMLGISRVQDMLTLGFMVKDVHILDVKNLGEVVGRKILKYRKTMQLFR